MQKLSESFDGSCPLDGKNPTLDKETILLQFLNSNIYSVVVIPKQQIQEMQNQW